MAFCRITEWVLTLALAGDGLFQEADQLTGRDTFVVAGLKRTLSRGWQLTQLACAGGGAVTATSTDRGPVVGSGRLPATVSDL